MCQDVVGREEKEIEILVLFFRRLTWRFCVLSVKNCSRPAGRRAREDR